MFLKVAVFDFRDHQVVGGRAIDHVRLPSIEFPNIAKLKNFVKIPFALASQDMTDNITQDISV